MGNKTKNEAVVSQVDKVLDQKLALLPRKVPELILEESLTNVYKKSVYRKNPKPAIGKKTSSFQQELGKIDPRSGNFICSKGIRDTILENSSAKDYSKTGNNFQNTGNVNRSGDYGNAGQRTHKKVEHQFPGQFLTIFCW